MPNKVFEKPTEIIKFDFKSQGAHLALVDSAANLVDVLVMKAVQPEVQVTLSMKEYLKKFFDLWEEDAAKLAGILGYSAEMYDSYEDNQGNYLTTEEYIKQEIGKVQLLKGKTEVDKLPKELFDKVSTLMLKADITKTSKDSPLEDLTISQGETMTPEQEKELVELRKAKADLESAQAELVELRKAKSEKELKEVVELVKGYSFVKAEDADALAVFFQKAKDIEGYSKALDALEAAKVAIDSFATSETGAATQEVEVSKSNSEKDMSELVAERLKLRKAKKASV